MDIIGILPMFAQIGCHCEGHQSLSCFTEAQKLIKGRTLTWCLQVGVVTNCKSGIYWHMDKCSEVRGDEDHTCTHIAAT